MKPALELSNPVIANRPIHGMGVIVIVLFLFHFARLSGYALWPVIAGLFFGLLSVASLYFRSTLVVQSSAPHLSRSWALLTIPLFKKQIDLSDAAWSQARLDLPDLVVEVGTRTGATIEIVRFKNAYGRKVPEVARLSTRVAEILHVEDRGYREADVHLHP